MGILAFYTNLAKPFCLRLDEHDLTNRLNWHDFNHLFGRLHWYEWCMKPRRKIQIKIPLVKLAEFSEAMQKNTRNAWLQNPSSK